MDLVNGLCYESYGGESFVFKECLSPSVPPSSLSSLPRSSGSNTEAATIY